MRAQRLGRLVLGLVLAASGCGGRGSGGAGGAGGSTGAPQASGSAVGATAASTRDPAQLAEWGEQARADLEADVARRIEEAKRVYGDDVPLRVESGLFVFVRAESSAPFDAAADQAQRGLDVFLGSFFARRPDRAVTVYVVTSAAAFTRLCEKRFVSGCERDLGAYSRARRDIVVNVGPGLPSTLHELVHPLVQTDFPRAPVWFEEGIAALFEKPVFDPPGELHGARNWRSDRIAAALAAPGLRGRVHLPALFAVNDATIDGPEQDLIYAMARTFCQWLDARGQLWPFYRAWREAVADDARGEKSFAQITGMTPAEADGAWLEWVTGRR